MKDFALGWFVLLFFSVAFWLTKPILEDTNAILPILCIVVGSHAKNTQITMDLRDKLIRNYNSRCLRAKIKIHYCKEDNALLRKEIVVLVSVLLGPRFTKM